MKKGRVYVISLRRAGIIASALMVIYLFFLAWEEPETSVLSYGVASKIIVVDPGHGGVDSGASRGNAVEEEITLAIAKRLTEYLSQAGAMVILLRENESDLAGDEFSGRIRDRKRKDMNTRVQKANEANADLFISIHTNAEAGTSWSGAQTFYLAGDEKSKRLAASIQEELKRVLGNTRRKSAAGNYFVLKKTKMPAVIVEVGFISNPAEAVKLRQPGYQSKIAYAIFMGAAASIQEEKTNTNDNKPGKP
ncbi:N-acetylmuramoyl-L-alanine amidase [Syntrophomonas palmitatica]|uniref:N-acetylmuramoyl-L-alanine amidase n=1 Tax=Syntrophomonas palmitatica TaxID=402877 RepID=UPI000AE79A2C|nr:N-acetylmuramoyl-L-alanine amidase [Syntrophomonas palmitatica]